MSLRDMWKLKKKEDPVEEEPEEIVEQPRKTENVARPIKPKEKESEVEQPTRQEVIDVLQGNLHRSAQLLELLRAMP